MTIKPYDIVEFSRTIRDRTIKRLESVPKDFINWRMNNTSLSFAHIAQHLINVDELFIKLVQSSRKQYKWILGTDEPHHAFIDLHKFKKKIIHLRQLKDDRANMILTLTEKELTEAIKSEEGEEITLGWFILEKIIEHEIYHRGQISAYLKIIKGESSS